MSDLSNKKGRAGMNPAFPKKAYLITGGRVRMNPALPKKAYLRTEGRAG